MEPSPSLINLKELPHHLLHKVIPKLPFKAINRFKCISKEIYSVITKDAQFAADQALSADACSSGFVYMTQSGLSFFPNTALIGVPDPSLKFLKATFSWIRLVSSANGLLLLFGEFDGMTSLCVCNPATKEMVLVPHYDIDRYYQLEMGLAFDPRKSPCRYTIVDPVLHNHGEGLLFSFSIFHSETGKWTCSHQTVYVNSLFAVARPVCANGVIYWCCRNDTYLLWYDTEKDVAGSMPLPVIGGKTDLGVYAGEVLYYSAWIGGIEVWRLTNEFRWNKIHATNWNCMVEAFNSCNDMQPHQKSPTNMYFQWRSVRPVGFDGRFFYIALRMRSQDVTEKLFSWDTKTGRVEEKGLITMNEPCQTPEVFSYANSLAKVPQVLNGAS